MTRYFSLVDRRTAAYRFLFRTRCHRHLFLRPLT
jgi:hypothetical protein